MDQKHVVIIGGGFGGTFTAKHLKPLVQSGNVRVTLINRTNFFLFTPLLHEVATGALSAMSVVEPLAEIFRDNNIHVLEEEVTAINPIRREVTTSSQTISYDYLVVSSGAETNYYNTPGARENTLVLKNLRDAEILRSRFISQCKKAADEKDETAKRKLLTYIVVGAGPTGIELAAELKEFIDHTMCAYYKMCDPKKTMVMVHLVAASPDVLPQFPPELRAIAHKELLKKGVNIRLNAMVKSVEPEKISFTDGTSIEAGTIVWVAGVKPSYLEIAGAEKGKSGRLALDPFLRTTNYKNIFSLGDASGNLPMLAQVASQQGKAVAHNIALSIANKPLVPFKFFEKGLLVSLGQWYAAGKIFGVTMKGPLMWWIWRTVYLFNFHSWRKRFRIAGEWTINLFSPRDITEV